MGEIIDIKSGGSPETALKEMLAKADQIDCVMIVSINKDGTQFLMTSSVSAMEKCFMKCFMDSYVSKWFFDSVKE